MDNVVSYLLAKFGDDRLWNGIALVLLITTTRTATRTTLVALENPFSGPTKTWWSYFMKYSAAHACFASLEHCYAGSFELDAHTVWNHLSSRCLCSTLVQYVRERPSRKAEHSRRSVVLERGGNSTFWHPSVNWGHPDRCNHQPPDTVQRRTCRSVQLFHFKQTNTQQRL